ncbi:MAG: DUF2892 domain-containing protein [Flavobacteriaceae bacterium]|nr:DUF2892 domain-containing protein [Flavobacteriaceae bacterium]
MKKNVGSTEKIVRYIVAAVAVWAAYTYQVASPWDYVLYAVAGIMVVTALANFCPLWTVFKINTSKKQE